MNNTNTLQFEAYNNFIKDPSPQNALDFVISCHKYICITASKWRQPDMTRKDKINEIITEMYLILIEDFSSGKAISCQSAFAYLDSKLRRLVNPAKKHFFSSLTDVSPTLLSSNNQFTIDKVNMIEEIVRIIRKNVLEDSVNNHGLVPFLFIHIYPKIHWISSILAERENVSAESRYEADAKRLNRFNNQLRNQFNKLTNGDWREILNWSLTERRHLAWKIISISPNEVELNAADDLNLVYNWRDNFDIHAHQDISKLNSALNVYNSMSRCFPKDNLAVAEENDFEETSPNVISMLISDYYAVENVVNEDKEYFESLGQCFENSVSNAEKDVEFMEAVQELNKCFGKILTERYKNTSRNKLNW
ncbi:MAG: hypothetical protein II567_01590 [Candidatus Riflebacteria bacterium]|nr:hypothetical protein [Candidatus Riflebacteria bacterium]